MATRDKKDDEIVLTSSLRLCHQPFDDITDVLIQSFIIALSTDDSTTVALETLSEACQSWIARGAGSLMKS